MEVFSYAMAQPYKIIVSMKADEVKETLDKFWDEHGEEMMSREPGGWTKTSALRSHMEKKQGVKLYYDLIWEWVQIAAGKSGLRVEHINSINVDKLDEKVGGLVSVIVNTVPKVNLGDYKNIKITAPPMVASEKEVQSQVFLALNHSSLASTLEFDKVLAEGDMVKLSFTCKSVDTGEMLDSREDITASLRPGGGAALTNELIGENTSTEVTKTITLPDDFPKKDMAGKEVVCEFKIGKVVVGDVPTEEEEARAQGLDIVAWKKKIKDDILIVLVRASNLSTISFSY